jgi:hypothetical protein
MKTPAPRRALGALLSVALGTLLPILGCNRTIHIVKAADSDLENGILERLPDNSVVRGREWNCDIFSTGDARGHCAAALASLAAQPDGSAALAELDKAIAAGRLKRDTWYGASLRALVRYSRGEVDLAAAEVHRATVYLPIGTALIALDDNAKFPALTEHYTGTFDESAFGDLDEVIEKRGGRFPGDYELLGPLFTTRAGDLAHPCPRPDLRPGVTPADGKTPQILTPGVGIRGLVLGKSTPEDVLRTYGCDAAVVRDASKQVVAINYALHVPRGSSIAEHRSPQRDRPQDFRFENGVLVRIGIDGQQWNVNLPNGFSAKPQAKTITVRDLARVYGDGCYVTPFEKDESFSVPFGPCLVYRYPAAYVAGVVCDSGIKNPDLSGADAFAHDWYVEGIFVYPREAAAKP